MGPILMGGLISAGASLLGGALNNRAQEKNLNNANAFSATQSGLDRNLQREFARYGLRWRVNDARAAGLHPLAALGAQLSPATPTGQMGQFESGSAKGDAIRAAGAALAESVARQGKEKAETRYLNAQADLTEIQARDSLVARTAQAQHTDVNTPGFKEVQQQRTVPLISTPFGNIRTSKNADAQTYEDRYGEVAGSMLGFSNVSADVWQTLKDAVVADLERDPGRIPRELRQFRSYRY